MAQKESSSPAKKPRKFPRSIAGMLSITGEFISQSSFGNVVQVIYRIWFLASFELGCNKLSHLNEMKFWNDWICASLFRYGIKGFKCVDNSKTLPEFETWLVITDLSGRVLSGFKLAELALKPALVLILWREEENSTLEQRNPLLAKVSTPMSRLVAKHTSTPPTLTLEPGLQQCSQYVVPALKWSSGWFYSGRFRVVQTHTYGCCSPRLGACERWHSATTKPTPHSVTADQLFTFLQSS